MRFLAGIALRGVVQLDEQEGAIFKRVAEDGVRDPPGAAEAQVPLYRLPHARPPDDDDIGPRLADCQLQRLDAGGGVEKMVSFRPQRTQRAQGFIRISM